MWWQVKNGVNTIEASKDNHHTLYILGSYIYKLKTKGGDNMTERITILLVVLILTSVMGVGVAELHVEIATSTQVIGNGTYDSEILLQSVNDAHGIKYYGEAYTPALGMFGPSDIILSTEYMLMRSNNSELQISEESEITNVRAKRCFKNYELSTLQAFNTFGDYAVLAEFGGDNNMSMMSVEAEISGKAVSEVTVRDINASHFYIVRDKAIYNGDFKILKSSLVEQLEEPRAGFCDWLGCP